ncbi:Cell wall-associated hydrolase, NlpC family [Aidingimonas halophila]|uniref:Cell wall-associated hydrolase, NlpC family n=2 Tax=Aidingimonas halophila TaxID=574349 RepID=A0A1H3FI55_9GAMM|nr:lipoprotein [Aidingimonas halophila]SDX90620.1 Cell wall-associated hydrolase, NlpC family [Aidingimonas halophila]
MQARDWQLWLFLMMLALLTGCAGQATIPRDDSRHAEDLSIERALILSRAKRAMGTPYRWGGTSESGLDCSGLVQMSYQAAGIAVPRSSDAQYRELPSVETARPGDLLFFATGKGRGKANHVGIYLGDGRMIHAPGRGRQVTTTSLDIDYWQKRYLGAAGPAP